MHDLLTAVALTGSGLCLAGHVPGPVRHWAPHAAAFAVMLPMAAGNPGPYALLVGAALTAGMCLLARGSDAADLAVMALLTAAAATGPTTHMDHAGGPGLFVLMLALWALARAGTFMHRALALSPRSPCRPATSPVPRLLNGIGGPVMILGMAAMLA